MLYVSIMNGLNMRHVFKKILYVTIIIAFLAQNSLIAQNIEFSQYYAAPLVLAPSLAGSANGGRVTLNYRDQWTGIKKGVFITSALGFDMSLSRIRSGIGILVVRDQAGAGNLGRLDFGVLYSWNTQISRSGLYFRPGLQIKLTQRSVDLTKLVFPDQLEFDVDHYRPSVNPPPPNVKKYFLDATASIMFYSSNFWFGVTADHLFRPNDAFYDYNYHVPIKYVSWGGYTFHRYSRGERNGDKYMISYNFRYQGGNMQLDLGGYWEHNPLELGIWLRGLPYLNITGTVNMDAIVFLVGYHIFNFTIGYSYDFTISPLLMTAGGSHEISINYVFNMQTRMRRRHGAIPCPGM